MAEQSLTNQHVSAWPPTIIVRDPRESPRKCSIMPLKGRPDLQFHTFPTEQPVSLAGYVRLAVDGPQLSTHDMNCGILLLDASWLRSTAMNKAFAHVPARALNGFLTAYPRRSKRGTDPDQGLASVEALYLAYHLLGRPTTGVLDTYYWAGEFLRLNSAVLASPPVK